ncbi:sulfur carrier protein ThiS [Microbulbifer sp. SAOS-129_SWC]|uniref:sulfur carrier protein ThiS n=1 Tax=Microbulbifer sp. SAOS-129_SWC TaxID=3145235 RepID=UPI003217A9C8
MQITVNGETHSLSAADSLANLLQQLGYGGEAFAVAVNGDFVARAEYAQTPIGDGDRVDVVAPVVGG